MHATSAEKMRKVRRAGRPEYPPDARPPRVGGRSPPSLAHGDPGDVEALATLRTLHRICRVYAAIGIAVPVFGFAAASSSASSAADG